MKRAFLFGLIVSCVDSGSTTKKIDRKFVQSNLVAEVPSDVVRADASLGPGKVSYVGNRVEPGTERGLVPGHSVRVTHYWRVDQAPGAGWRVFGFMRGAPGTSDFAYIAPSEMELAHPVESWRAGEIIQDANEVIVRPDWTSRTATLYMGLVRTEGHAIGDRMVASGPKTFERAIITNVFDIDLSKAPPSPGTVYVPRTSAPIAIDGLGMDSGWANAAVSPDFPTAEGSPEPNGRATAKLTWNDDYLYVLVQVADTDIYSPYKQHDDPLWKADAVEVFIDADGNRRGYIELQVNPNNATFDAWFATTRAQPGDPKWDSGMRTAVNVRGTADQAGDSDAGWSAEMAIPWAAVKGKDDAMQIRTPPHVGDRWHLNVVRVDAKADGKAIAASSWNKITYGDFHALDRMLTVVFADPSGSITPALPGSAGP